jgi:hypothetical protein
VGSLSWYLEGTPSAPVQALIDQNLHDLGLTPNNYVTAHVRTAYTRGTIAKHEEINAVNCAARLAGNATTWTPIYFASDSFCCNNAYGFRVRHPATPICRCQERHSEPLHLDRGSELLLEGYFQDRGQRLERQTGV